MSTSTKVRRTETPQVHVGERGGVQLTITLSEAPDAEWERMFKADADDVVGDAATRNLRIHRPGPNAHPGLGPHPTTVLVNLQSDDEVRTATENLDLLIAQTNTKFETVVLPRRQSEQDARERAESDRDARQARLDAIAAELPPPPA